MAVFTPHVSSASVLPALNAQLRQINDTHAELAKRPMQSAEVSDVCREFDKQLTLMHTVFDRMHSVMSQPDLHTGERARYADPFLMISLMNENRKLTKRLDQLDEDFQKRKRSGWRQSRRN